MAVLLIRVSCLMMMSIDGVISVCEVSLLIKEKKSNFCHTLQLTSFHMFFTIKHTSREGCENKNF